VVALIFGSFFVALFADMMISLALGASSVLAIIYSRAIPMIVVPQRIAASLDSVSLLAIPLFILAGMVMSEAGIGEKIVEAVNTLVRHIRGGLAHVNILASLVFGGISASSVADTAAIGGIMIPSMQRRGYPTDFSVAVTAASSPLSAIVPPSTLMIIYSSLTGASVASLFLAGFIPGVIFAGAECVAAYVISKRCGYGTIEKRASPREIATAFFRCLPALLMPVIIIGGMLGGIFTVTEAGAVAVVYGLIVSVLIYHTMTWKRLVRCFAETARLTGAIGLVMGIAGLFAWIIASQQVPQAIVRTMLSIAKSPWFFLLLVNILFLFVGMFINAGTAMVILVPLLYPVAQALGIDLVHFGIITVVNFGIGAVTPPVGTCLLTACSTAGITVDKSIRAVTPFMLAMVIALLIITYWPGGVMFLPRLMAAR